MNTNKVKLQLPCSAALLQAINKASAKDLRTQRAFVTKLLQEHPLVAAFLVEEPIKSVAVVSQPRCNPTASVSTPAPAPCLPVQTLRLYPSTKPEIYPPESIEAELQAEQDAGRS